MKKNNNFSLIRICTKFTLAYKIYSSELINSLKNQHSVFPSHVDGSDLSKSVGWSICNNWIGCLCLLTEVVLNHFTHGAGKPYEVQIK